MGWERGTGNKGGKRKRGNDEPNVKLKNIILLYRLALNLSKAGITGVSHHAKQESVIIMSVP